MSAPSIFRHAPSELSQDAFLAWLAEWADPTLSKVNLPLHQTGQRFLMSLLESAGHEPMQVESVRVHRQLQKIDLIIVINKRIAIVVEDKVHAREHGKQLERYRNAATHHLGFSPHDVVCIYLKTGEQSDTSGVEQAGFSFYDRARLLRVLRKGIESGVDNDIYADFTAHIERLEAQIGAWRTSPVHDWSVHDPLWKGFFSEVRDALGEGSWGWVNNRGGGFFGLWWCWVPVEGGHLYLQADSWQVPRLGVRTWTRDSDKAQFSPMHLRWRSRVASTAAAAGIPFALPRRPRSGRSSEVARLEGPWVVSGRNGRVDVEATVEALRRYTAFLRETNWALHG